MKKLLSAILGLTMIFSLSATAFAEDLPTTKNIKLEVQDGVTVSANIPSEYSSLISNQELIDIALDEGLQNGDCIEIHHVENVPDVHTPEPNIIVVNTYPTRLKAVGSEWAAQNYFVISAAKGEVVTLEREYTKTLTAGISGEYYSITPELEKSVTVRYSETKEYVGPPEDSPYNSREYRVRFYAQTYNYSQDHYMSGMYIGTKTGTVDKPTRYASYSILHLES